MKVVGPTPEQTECIKCQECCKWLGVAQPTITRDDAEFFLMRGCRIAVIENEGKKAAIIYIKHICPNLTETGCRIYTVRPRACREYRGADPIVADVCQFRKADGK
jgi:Fe-S-cluster containining protein